MSQRPWLYRAVIATAGVILAYQLFLPPIVGIADQGDFSRIIGRFGYAPELRSDDLRFVYVLPKYVRDNNYRYREWEQFSSEYFFVAAAILLNQLVSKDGKLGIEVIGLVHSLIFLLAFARLLRATRTSPGRAFIWTAALLVLTDVAYAGYLNTFYAEPASLLFGLLLFAESVEICNRGDATVPALMRWCLWAVLFVLAKPQNITIGLLLGLFCWHLGRSAGRLRWLSIAAVFSAVVFSYATTPAELKKVCTYNLIFLAVLPESRNPAADLEALGLDPALRDYSRTGPWSANTAFPRLVESGVLGHRVTQATVARFYLTHPTRLWRHIQAELPTATVLRSHDYGNFEPAAGFPPGAKSRAFAMWSDFHAGALAHCSKVWLFGLAAVPLAAILRRRRSDLRLDFFALAAMCCLLAFLTAIFADAWDDVKHLFMFNLLLDGCLISTAAGAWSLVQSRFWAGHDAKTVKQEIRLRAKAQSV